MVDEKDKPEGFSEEPRSGALKQVLRDHKLWLDSKGRKGERLNLYGADLTAAVFSEANLYQAHFKGAKLQAADFTNADLSGANFGAAKLTRAKFAGAAMPRERSGASR